MLMAAVGVGKNPEAVSLVRGADGRRGNAVPDDTIPDLGQVSENASKVPVSKESWDVLQERVSGSYLAKDPGGVGPHVALVVFSSPGSGGREGLTGESARDEIHRATPGSTAEGPDVIPDREQGEHAVPLSSE